MITSMKRTIFLGVGSSAFASMSLLSAIVTHRKPLIFASLCLLAFNTFLMIRNIMRLRARSLEERS